MNRLTRSLQSLSVVLLLVVFVTATSSRADDVIYSTTAPLKTPRKAAPRGGGPLDQVELSIWVPGDVTTIRGALINPFYVDAVKQQHWREACRLWGFALIGGNYFGVKNEEFKETLETAMKQFAEQSKHPEIAHLPLIFTGMSAGAGMSVTFAAAMPDRTIAVVPVCLEVGPRSVESYTIPMLTIFGEKDGKQMAQLMETLPQLRKETAQWAIAVQWGQGHEFFRANNLAMPFLDAVIAARYPKDSLPVSGPVKLVDIDEKSGWLVDPARWKTNDAAIAAWADATGDKANQGWVPTEGVAMVWRAMVSHNPQITITSPAGMGDGQAFKLHSKSEPLVVTAKVDAALHAATIELFDGAANLGKLSRQGDQFTITVNKLEPGVHGLFIVATSSDGVRHWSRPSTILVGK